MRRRDICLASAVAPLSALGIILGAYVVAGLLTRDGGPIVVGVFVAVFGALPAYGIALLLGVPAMLCLERAGILTLRSAAGVGALLGALVALLIHGFTDDPAARGRVPPLVMDVVASAAGGVSAGVWLRIARRARPRRQDRVSEG